MNKIMKSWLHYCKYCEQFKAIQQSRHDTQKYNKTERCKMAYVLRRIKT